MLLMLLFTGFSASAWAYACCDEAAARLSVQHSDTQHHHEDPGQQAPGLHHSCCGALIVSTYPEGKHFPVTMAYPLAGDTAIPDHPVYPIDDPPKEFGHVFKSFN